MTIWRAQFLIVNGHEPDPIRVTLQATATVTGRLIDEQGKPRPNIPIVVKQMFRTFSCDRFSVQPPTGPDGRFRIRGLVPGVAYSVEAVELDNTTHQNRFLGWIGKPEQRFKTGETQDWGDVSHQGILPIAPLRSLNHSAASASLTAQPISGRRVSVSGSWATPTNPPRNSMSKERSR